MMSNEIYLLDISMKHFLTEEMKFKIIVKSESEDEAKSILKSIIDIKKRQNAFRLVDTFKDIDAIIVESNMSICYDYKYYADVIIKKETTIISSSITKRSINDIFEIDKHNINENNSDAFILIMQVDVGYDDYNAAIAMAASSKEATEKIKEDMYDITILSNENYTEYMKKYLIQHNAIIYRGKCYNGYSIKDYSRYFDFSIFFIDISGIAILPIGLNK